MLVATTSTSIYGRSYHYEPASSSLTVALPVRPSTFAPVAVLTSVPNVFSALPQVLAVPALPPTILSRTVSTCSSPPTPIPSDDLQYRPLPSFKAKPSRAAAAAAATAFASWVREDSLKAREIERSLNNLQQRRAADLLEYHTFGNAAAAAATADVSPTVIAPWRRQASSLSPSLPPPACARRPPLRPPSGLSVNDTCLSPQLGCILLPAALAHDAALSALASAANALLAAATAAVTAYNLRLSTLTTCIVLPAAAPAVLPVTRAPAFQPVAPTQVPTVPVRPPSLPSCTVCTYPPPTHTPLGDLKVPLPPSSIFGFSRSPTPPSPPLAPPPTYSSVVSGARFATSVTPPPSTLIDRAALLAASAALFRPLLLPRFGRGAFRWRRPSDPS